MNRNGFTPRFLLSLAFGPGRQPSLSASDKPSPLTWKTIPEGFLNGYYQNDATRQGKIIIKRALTVYGQNAPNTEALQPAVPFIRKVHISPEDSALAPIEIKTIINETNMQFDVVKRCRLHDCQHTPGYLDYSSNTIAGF